MGVNLGKRNPERASCWHRVQNPRLSSSFTISSSSDGSTSFASESEASPDLFASSTFMVNEWNRFDNTVGLKGAQTILFTVSGLNLKALKEIAHSRLSENERLVQMDVDCSWVAHKLAAKNGNFDQAAKMTQLTSFFFLSSSWIHSRPDLRPQVSPSFQTRINGANCRKRKGPADCTLLAIPTDCLIAENCSFYPDSTGERRN